MPAPPSNNNRPKPSVSGPAKPLPDRLTGDARRKESDDNRRTGDGAQRAEGYQPRQQPPSLSSSAPDGGPAFADDSEESFAGEMARREDEEAEDQEEEQDRSLSGRFAGVAARLALKATPVGRAVSAVGGDKEVGKFIQKHGKKMIACSCLGCLSPFIVITLQAIVVYLLITEAFG